MSRHERWGSLCHFCEESWPCETVTLRDENAKRREQADALAAALESLVAECDKTMRWRDTRGMRTATDLSAFASTSYSGVLEIRRALQAALEKGGPPLSAEEMEAAKGAERGR